MTCSPNNFPRGKKVEPNGTGTKVYTDQYANETLTCHIYRHRPKLNASMCLVSQYKTAAVKLTEFVNFENFFGTILLVELYTQSRVVVSKQELMTSLIVR